MNWICSVVICTLVAVGEVVPQHQSTPRSAAVQKQASDHDLNIDAYVQLLRSDLRNSKSQIVGQAMQLSADQSAAFWPIYKQFEADSTKVGDRTVALIK